MVVSEFQRANGFNLYWTLLSCLYLTWWNTLMRFQFINNVVIPTSGLESMLIRCSWLLSIKHCFLFIEQPCLGGDSKTLMFVNVSPDPSSIGESLCSLRFAARVNACEIGIPRRQTTLRPSDSRLSYGWPRAPHLLHLLSTFVHLKFTQINCYMQE